MSATGNKKRRRARTREMDERDHNWCHKRPTGSNQVSDCDQASWRATAAAALRVVRLGRARRVARPVSSKLPFASRLVQQRRRRQQRFALFTLIVCCLLVVIALVAAGQSDNHRAGQPTSWRQFGAGRREHSTGTPVIIRTDQNQLFRGLRTGSRNTPDVISFLGIRYASAPIRRLRFMPPSPFTYAAPNQPAAIHEARHLGPICVQRLPVSFNRQQADELLLYLQDNRTARTMTSIDGGQQLAGNNRRPSERLVELQLDLMDELLVGAPPRRHFKQLLELHQSEDCLNLNIFAPIEALRERLVSEADGLEMAPAPAGRVSTPDENDSQLRPVLVIVHGDSYDFGSGATISGARHFARRHRLLVVTFNFRLNLLGFPPKLGGPLRSNLGLLDQVALLHWIRANIRSFGGSPQNVTLLGTKRGAVLVNLLMVSPLAKGLFQRAIIEDGTALSPMVANNVQPPVTANGASGQQQQQQQVGLQHLRLLALMADCPPAPAAPSAGQTAMNASSSSGGFQGLSASQLECLRSSPVEALAQHIPLGLLEANANELVLARRWHRPLELLARNLLELDQALVAANIRQALNELANRIIRADQEAPTAAGGQVTLTPSQVNKLIAHLVATKQSITSAASNGANSPGGAPTGELASSGSGGGGRATVGELLDELLSAIYLPSNETLMVAPFAPQLELGTILLRDELDLTGSMLHKQSPYGAQDLLVGSSMPLIEAVAAGRDHGNQEEATSSDLLPLNPTQLVQEWPVNNLIHPMERLSKRIVHDIGLTEEQAIQQVNLFVRTHFRYHQQEISNSIINNYFLSDQLVTTRQTSVFSHTPDKPSTKQVQLLRSLLAAYQDSLISLPLIKTALIHSLKQLESLGEIFANDQIYQLNERVKQTGDVAKLLVDYERQKLPELELEFNKFAQNLYNDTRLWPIRLRDDGSDARDAQPLSGAHSTYLFQFSNVLRELMSKLLGVVAKLDINVDPRRYKTLASIRANLIDSLLKRINAGELSSNFGIACGLHERVEDDDDDDDSSDLLARIKAALCDQLGGNIIANFAIGANVNTPPNDIADPTASQLELQLDQHELDCELDKSGGGGGESQQAMNQLDHHSVHLGAADSHGVAQNSSVEVGGGDMGRRAECQRRLNELTFEYLAQELRQLNDNSRVQPWTVFNVFGQQMASIEQPVVLSNDAPTTTTWSLESLASPNHHQQERDKFDRKIAFWANYIATLNCSRTQPISASALSQASNSTLLNMNLIFNCQSSGSSPNARTAATMMQSIQVRIRSILSEFIESLARQHAHKFAPAAAHHTLSASSQNHHSLRMATGTNESQLDSELTTETPANRQLNSSLDNSRWLAANSQHELTPSQLANGTTTTTATAVLRWWLASSGQRTLHAGLWLFAGTILLGSTLLTGGCALAKHLRGRRVPQPPPPASSSSSSSAAASASASDHQKEHDLAAIAQAAGQDFSSMIQQQQQQRANQLQTSSDNSLTPPSLLLKPNGLRQVDEDYLYSHPSDLLLDQTSTSFIEYNSHGQQQQQPRLGTQMPDDQYRRGSGQLAAPIIAPAQYAAAAQQHQQHQHQLEHQHLPGCSLATVAAVDANLNGELQMHQQGMLSSSSETTTTNRAHSSVSLISSSTNTTTIANNQTRNGLGTSSSGKHLPPSGKKRVKISDPKRLHEAPNYLMPVNYNPATESSEQLYFNGDGFLTPINFEPIEDQQAAAATHFCPIHRAASSNYLLSPQEARLELQQLDSAANGLMPDAIGTDGGQRYFELLGQQPDKSPNQSQAVATVGSLAEYLNMLTHQQQQQQHQPGGSNSLSNTLVRYGAGGNRRHRGHHAMTNPGLCQAHSNGIDGMNTDLNSN